MSSEEWKTVRMQASTYYKLVDLNSLLSMVIGRKMSLNLTADVVVVSFYNQLYSRLVDIISDADKLSQARKEIGGALDKLEKLTRELK